VNIYYQAWLAAHLPQK